MDAALRDEATQLLRDLIRIDTTNPPGRETAAATFLKDYLEREGIACELVAKDPDRANLIARIPGTGEGPSLTLLGHTDVVYADAEDWQVDPFAGEVLDGHVWGRGALDMKSHTVCNALAFARLARSGFQPRGDLVLIAEADEEHGTLEVGLPFVVEQRPDVRTDYALNEGGGERLVLADGRVVYMYTPSEKATMPTRVITRGTAGHASVPILGDNALPKLGPVLERLSAYETTPRLEPELAAMLDALAPSNGDGEASRVARARALHPLLDALIPPMQRATLTPTMATASRQRNVIPSRAYVTCDCRVLPGTTVDELHAEFANALDGLPYELEPDEPPTGGTRSPLGTPLERVLADYVEQIAPGAMLVPAMAVGFTNSHFLRDAFGTVAYGFFPLVHTAPEILNETIHAPDERIHQDDLVVGVRYLEHACREIGRYT